LKLRRLYNLSNDLESLVKEFNLVKDLNIPSKTFKELYAKQIADKLCSYLSEVDSETILQIQSELNSLL